MYKSFQNINLKGNFWVYASYNDVRYNKDQDALNYCEKNVYLLAFWSITLVWILLAFFCALFCFCFCLACGLSSIMLCCNCGLKDNASAQRNEDQVEPQDQEEEDGNDEEQENIDKNPESQK